ncbi:formate--tetrahydrofolate ligase [Methylovorus menthalis]|uniref:formate--tetrahydrofolate ligase n=1 Tax=Methylovorus menthalis TaxID=1002227 RepID=UPI001E41DD3A|nr:formate--tetrahydrofolate ligase [Methylovorus menthalis]MCB4810370.1 formate--tetrahydrofolate ligase [Methylovorus menthalis]
MTSDIEIAQQASILPMEDIAARLGLPATVLELYGAHKAKINLHKLPVPAHEKQGSLILVSAISPTPAGEGKTTTTIGLGDALQHIGKSVCICLREPSMGPVFGMKGGATGGGHAQVMPMEDINLHFTGDFAAIAAAHNLLAALIDNHLHQGNTLGLDVRRITWRRVLDTNDRALRQVVVGLGGKANGYPREDGFDIVVASEVMAILCLASSLADLKRRLGNIVVGYRTDGQAVTAGQLQAQGAMAVLLKEAIKPNLVQTLEHTPALIHGGPFANIAHGCNSVLATRMALQHADYVVTEAGFGADLGAEKFIDIKCRKSGLRPQACVIVATVRALKYHGGEPLAALAQESLPALKQGLANLQKHVENVSTHYGLPCVVALNRFAQDTEAELALVQACMAEQGVKVVMCTHWADGGAGAEALAHEVVRLAAGESAVRFVYADEDTLWEKLRKLATAVYGAADIAASSQVRAQLQAWQDAGYGHYPICVAKTPYSFSTDAALRGVAVGHTLAVREVRLCAGAEFIVMICDGVNTMPGLPAEPAANRIDIDDDGRVSGLF